MEADSRKSEFIGLVEANRGMLAKVCRLYGEDAEDRRDLFQEIVEQLWASYGSFAGKAKFSTWLYRVALNTALYHLRRRKKRQLSPQAQEDLLRSNHEGDRLAADIRTLYTAIERLNKIDKAIVLLYLERKSYQEMAEILGITASHVGVRLVRAKDKLIKAFEECRTMEEATP